jgi:hypothetical protein
MARIVDNLDELLAVDALVNLADLERVKEFDALWNRPTIPKSIASKDDAKRLRRFARLFGQLAEIGSNYPKVLNLWVNNLLCLRTQSGLRSARVGLDADSSDRRFWWTIERFVANPIGEIRGHRLVPRWFRPCDFEPQYVQITERDLEALDCGGLNEEGKWDAIAVLRFFLPLFVLLLSKYPPICHVCGDAFRIRESAKRGSRPTRCRRCVNAASYGKRRKEDLEGLRKLWRASKSKNKAKTG